MELQLWKNMLRLTIVIPSWKSWYRIPAVLPHQKLLVIKRAHVFSSSIWVSFYFKFRKDDPTQVGFFDNLMLLVVKRLLPMRIVRFVRLQRLSYKLYPWIVFSSKKDFFENVLPSLVENEFVCVAYIGWLFIYHLEIQFIDVKRNAWYFLCVVVNLFLVIGRWSMSLLANLRWLTQVAQLWLLNCKSY